MIVPRMTARAATRNRPRGARRLKRSELSPALDDRRLAGVGGGDVAWAPFLGMESIPFRALWGGVDDYTVDILWKLRIRGY